MRKVFLSLALALASLAFAHVGHAATVDIGFSTEVVPVLPVLAVGGGSSNMDIGSGSIDRTAWQPEAVAVVIAGKPKNNGLTKLTNSRIWSDGIGIAHKLQAGPFEVGWRS